MMGKSSRVHTFDETQSIHDGLFPAIPDPFVPYDLTEHRKISSTPTKNTPPPHRQMITMETYLISYATP